MGIALLPVAFAVWRWLKPHLPKDMVAPVIAYVVVISMMVGLAVGTAAVQWSAPLVVGAFAFYASDISVARERFVARGYVNRLWGLPAYYVGQLLLAWTV